MASLIMGAWFYMTAVGNFVAGKIGEATGGHDGEMTKQGLLDIYEHVRLDRDRRRRRRPAALADRQAAGCISTRCRTTRIDARRSGELGRAAGGGHPHASQAEGRSLIARAGTRRSTATAAAALLFGCAISAPRAAAASDRAKAPPALPMPPAIPIPSTYRPYPGVPTAITGATVFDGEGGRIENGTVVLADGRIQAVGGPDTPIPAGRDPDRRPRQMGDARDHRRPLPSRRLSVPRRRGASGRQRGRPGRSVPKSGPSTASGRRIRASAARSPMAGSPRCRSCPARPTCSAAAAVTLQERAGADHAGDEVPGRAATA